MLAVLVGVPAMTAALFKVRVRLELVTCARWVQVPLVGSLQPVGTAALQTQTKPVEALGNASVEIARLALGLPATSTGVPMATGYPTTRAIDAKSPEGGPPVTVA